MKISFIGLGKLGLPLATNFAKNGHYVIAIDKNQQLIDKLKNGISPWIENGLKENLELSKLNIEFTGNYSKISETDVTIILVNTPSNKKDGSFSNLYVEQSIQESVLELKKNNKSNHLFILSSTVMPTSIDNSFITLIENLSGWELNKDYGFCYVPDFVALGQVIHDFENPDFLLIGQSNDKYGDITEEIYKSIIKNDTKIFRLSLIESEICKVSLNAFITTKISFANFLGLLCEKIDKKINVDNITNTIGQDKRIGTKYFKSGTSYGGTCFPRDTWAFMKLSSNFGLQAHQMEANELINNMTDETVLLKILKSNKNNIGFVGLGFKSNTSVVTEGLAVKIINMIKDRNYNIFIHDEFLESYINIEKETDAKFTICYEIDKLVEYSDVIVLCNNSDKYQIVSNNKIIIDPWRLQNKNI